MQVLGVIIGVFLFGCAYSLNVPSGKLLTLVPKTGVRETYWELTSDPGTKMILTCLFDTYSCRQAAIKIFDGLKYIQYCPEQTRFIIRRSQKNKLSVTIENSLTTSGAFCQVKATDPYIDLPNEVVDSSEHGTGSGECGKRNHSPARIVNGKETGVNEFPFATLIILYDSKFPFCGGSIISPRHILTAAHCTEPFENRQLAVVVGEHDIRTWKETKYTEMHLVGKVHQHKDYSNSDNKHDIAILELKTRIAFNPYVGPVCLPKGPELEDQIKKKLKVMGWGLVKDKNQGGLASPTLRQTNLKIIDLGICKSIYNSINLSPPTQICTYGDNTDSCQGDSGGPLVNIDPATNRYVQFAVVSYGMECASTDPAVNTRVSYFMPWIKEQVAKCSEKVSIYH